MNEKERKIQTDLHQAVNNLAELGQTDLTNDVAQDAFIKRFELLYELGWKWLKIKLEQEGIIAKSPRQVFKQAVSMGWIKNRHDWLKMIEIRNILIHTYSAEKAREAVPDIKETFLPLFNQILDI